MAIEFRGENLRSISIDAESGDIVSMIDISKKEHSPNDKGAEKISFEDGFQIVKEVVNVPQNYKKFIFGEAGDSHYHYSWVRYEDEIKVASDKIMVLVDPYSSNIFSYLNVYHEKIPELQPVVASKKAEEVALNLLKGWQ